MLERGDIPNLPAFTLQLTFLTGYFRLAFYFFIKNSACFSKIYQKVSIYLSKMYLCLVYQKIMSIELSALKPAIKDVVTNRLCMINPYSPACGPGYNNHNFVGQPPLVMGKEPWWGYGRGGLKVSPSPSAHFLPIGNCLNQGFILTSLQVVLSLAIQGLVKAYK